MAITTDQQAYLKHQFILQLEVFLPFRLVIHVKILDVLTARPIQCLQQHVMFASLSFQILLLAVN